MSEKLMKIQTELKAPKNQRNTFGNYDFRSCEDILEGLKPLLLLYNCSLVINDNIKLVGDRYYIEAIAILTDNDLSGTDKYIGEAKAYAREPETKKGMDLAQVTGATSSYARKYALNGLFAIDDNKDADTVENKAEELQKAKEQNEAIKKANDLKKEMNDYKKEIGATLLKLTEQGINKKAIENSIKHHLGVNSLIECNDIEKLKAYYLKKTNDLKELIEKGE